jgi:glycosyltransferase involved in cell wall biosynthesis
MNPERPDIAVVVRTSGRPRCYLDRALTSIRAQTCRPAQVIISDDAGGGVAPTEEDQRIVWVTRPSHERPHRSKTLNRAIQHVVAPWVAFLDDDDTWRPEFLERMGAAAVSALQTREIGALCCRTEAWYEDEKGGCFTCLGKEPFNPDLTEITLAELVKQNLFTNNAVLWRREVFARIGGYREDIQVLEDWEFNVRACRSFPMAVLPLTLAHYHQRPGIRDHHEANSSKSEHDAVLVQLAQEWRASGLLPADRGWHWLRNRLRHVRHRWARWRFDQRWRMVR